uniref:PB1 domain-containing protein n=1 Tax=Amorphochlora amoebiformis TaxID=1561963 RepID=A0A7S0GTD9_9EUKA
MSDGFPGIRYLSSTQQYRNEYQDRSPLHNMVFSPFFTKVPVEPRNKTRIRKSSSDPAIYKPETLEGGDKATYEAVQNSGKVILIRDAVRAVERKLSYRAWLYDFSPRDASDPERNNRISSRAGITSAFAQAWVGAGGTFTKEERESMELTPEEKHQQQMYLLTRQWKKQVSPKKASAKSRLLRCYVRVVCHGRVHRINLAERSDPFAFLVGKLFQLLGRQMNSMEVVVPPSDAQNTAVVLKSDKQLQRILQEYSHTEAEKPIKLKVVKKSVRSRGDGTRASLQATLKSLAATQTLHDADALSAIREDHYGNPRVSLNAKFESKSDSLLHTGLPPEPSMPPPPPPPFAVSTSNLPSASPITQGTPSNLKLEKGRSPVEWARDEKPTPD